MNHKPETYALSEAEHEDIFRSVVLPDYIREFHTPSPHPTAVILGGQPGAGKTALLKPAETDLGAIGPTVVINGDELRSYHPQYRSLQAADPENAAQLTNLDSGRWVEKLIAAGTERQVNLVIESTMRNPDVFAATSQRLRDAGYTVEARAIAVNERESWQGVHARYEGMIENDAAPRFTLREAHDAGVTGMLSTLERIESEKLADRVLIGTRGGTVIYDNQIENDQWKNPPQAAQFVLGERNRVRTHAEIEAFSAGWLSVIAKMEARHAGTGRIAAVETMAKDDTAYFRTQWKTADGIASVSLAEPEAPDVIDRRQHQRTPDNLLSRSQEPLIPAQTLPDLTPAEASAKAVNSERAAGRRAEMETLSSLVYGNGTAIASTVEDISRNPALGSSAANSVRTTPEQIAPLAGEAGGWFRAASFERQTAEAHAPRMAAALEDYSRTLQYEQSRAVEKHRDEQRRVAASVPSPSPELAEILQSPIAEQNRHFEARPEARQELSRLSVALQKRLSPSDHRALRLGDQAGLAQSLKISPDQTKRVAQVHSQLQQASTQVRTRQQELAKTQDTVLKITR